MSLLVFCCDDQPLGVLAVADDERCVRAQRDFLLVGIAIAGQLLLLFFFSFVFGAQLFYRLIGILSLGESFLACFLLSLLLFLSVCLSLLFLLLLLVDLILACLPIETLIGFLEERNMVIELHEVEVARDV